MIKHLRGFVIASLLGFASPVSYAQDVLIFADDNYRPVTYLNAENEPSGVLADVLQHYSAVTGENITIKLYPWKRAYVSAKKGLGGVIGLSMTEERLKLFDFSQPIYDDNINVIVLKGQEFDFKTLSDLKGKKIGVQLGASYGTEVDTAIRSGNLTVEPDQNHHSRLLKLLYGRIDAAFIGNGHAGLDTLLESDPALAEHKAAFAILPVPLNHDQLYLGFAKSMQMHDFLKKFDKVLSEHQAQQAANKKANALN